MDGRVSPRQNARVRGQRQRNGGDGVGEERAARGQGIEIWCLNGPIPVTAQVVGPQRVNGDEENVVGNAPCARNRARGCCAQAGVQDRGKGRHPDKDEAGGDPLPFSRVVHGFPGKDTTRHRGSQHTPKQERAGERSDPSGLR